MSGRRSSRSTLIAIFPPPVPSGSVRESHGLLDPLRTFLGSLIWGPYWDHIGYYWPMVPMVPSPMGP